MVDVSEHTQNDAEAIARRWSTDHDRGAADYTDAGCRVLAEHAFRNVNALLADRVSLEAEREKLRREVSHLADVLETCVVPAEEWEATHNDGDPDWSGVIANVVRALRAALAGTADTPTREEGPTLGDIAEDEAWREHVDERIRADAEIRGYAPSGGAIPGPDPGACPGCGQWLKAGLAHDCPAASPVSEEQG